MRADPSFAGFVSSLRQESYLLKIVNCGLDLLRDNMLAGERIEKIKFPKHYIRKYGLSNLYKLNLNSRHRLIYTLVSDDLGISVVILEILDHKEYCRRFGYK